MTGKQHAVMRGAVPEQGVGKGQRWSTSRWSQRAGDGQSVRKLTVVARVGMRVLARLRCFEF